MILQNICPYDLTPCNAYMERLLKMQKQLETARKNRSTQIFFSEESVPDGCPLPEYEKKNTCIRYQIWAKNHINEQ